MPVRRPAPSARRSDPSEVQGRMKPVSHNGPLPWVQLRNAMFHPSIYRKMIGRIDPRAKNGDLVFVYDRDGEPFGTGLLSTQAPIGLRMLTFDATPVNESLVGERLSRAVAFRREVLQLDKSTNAY